MADIVGIEGLSVDDVRARVEQGGRFVVYSWALSLLVVTLRRPSAIHFVHAGESATLKGLPYTILSFFVGWWGFPWGFIYTPMVIATNLGGGKDVTAEVMRSLDSSWQGRANPGTAFGGAPAAVGLPSSAQASIDTDAKAALYLSLPGLLCFPLGWVGAFFGFRAISRARAEGLSSPPLAFVGLGLAGLSTLCIGASMVVGALNPKPATPRAAQVAPARVEPVSDDDGKQLPR